MNQYKYKAKDKTGGLIEGKVEAETPEIAAKLLRQKSLLVISLKPIRELPFNVFKKYQSRVKASDIATFTRQLATMINAGLPITEALVILRSQVKGSLQQISSQILADVEGGESLSNSMSKYPHVFSKSYIALIKSGEVGGVMDEVMVRLADNLEKQEEFKGKVKGAMVYPVIVIIGMIVVGFIMLIFVIPRLTSIYEQFGADLPITTKFLVSISGFMAKFWPFVIGAMALVAYAFKSYKATEIGRRKVDEIIIRLPLIGDLQREIMLTEITRTLSLMVGSGVSILDGLKITSEVVENVVLGDSLADAAILVEKGFPVSYAFSKHPDAFPFILSQMISVGEETGKMDEVLEKVSHIFEVESDQRVKTLTAAVEPLILIVLGLGVAFLVISIIVPIYNLSTQL
ncbi:MAG: hypothetical protein UT61_C0045G0008 [Candidatus Woesebacteria bacterium GW2011_GWA1_39_8]|jgi:type IV pilus assembly protein PilC|uniref:Type II secretion system protein GspF domain-containing protein n=1 Tax=Candidatus Woesebacteria bacterium GW2011_GWA1_39_8 TaxID=1618552 RepID=A0A0G0SSV2_9BACT|nr:MAG: hypothetical protein UT61_C0045G0008 [Candidatus Woesebacteria bacterium GW2011_GWA1_39_8]